LKFTITVPFFNKKENVCLESTHTNVPTPLKLSVEWGEENIIIIFFFFASDSTGDTPLLPIYKLGIFHAFINLTNVN
jgi:hypothetical protein